jgi:thioredoxin 1
MLPYLPQALTFLSALANINITPTLKEQSMADIPKLTEAVFEVEVINSTLPVMVDFTATWCGPCKMLDPVVTQLSQDWKGKVKVVKLDVDDNSNIAMQYGVMGVPTLILFVGGNPVQRLSGYQPKDRIVSKFGSYF